MRGKAGDEGTTGLEDRRSVVLSRNFGVGSERPTVRTTSNGSESVRFIGLRFTGA
jgi:hypothetical protein